MNDFNQIFTNEQYILMQQAYEKSMQPQPQQFQNILQSIINTLNHLSFKIPPTLQTQIIQSLSQAQQILSITFSKTPHSTLPISHNIFNLISHLIQLSNELTSHSIKSPYQTLLLKSNKIILQTIQQICSYFENRR
jgi:hypothetical protein